MIEGKSQTQTETRDDHSTRTNSPSANANNIGVPPNLFWANTLISSLALVVAIVAVASAWWEAKEVKQLQVQLMYVNALMVRGGLVRPGDVVFGPEANLEYKGDYKFVPKKEK